MGKDVVHGGNGIQGFGKTDKGGTLVNRFPDFQRRDSHIQTSLYMGFKLGQGLVYCQHRNSNQFPEPVIQGTGAADFTKNEPLENPHEFRIRAFVLHRFASEKFTEFLLGFCYSF